MQDTIKDLKEQMQNISFVVHEASEERHTREKKNLVICFTCIIITLIIVFATYVIIDKVKDNSMETVTETETTEEITEKITYEDVEQNTDGGGNNVIGGDING